ncbi:uncharacterized protein K02A2.6-like [Macrosteles quadrilineatus]|uniref:uncharacterized protein K02A2.6-like n=1 Tax=Macrosteles quadrilineatus TaxID=74068 RepID=UPI0023E2BB79|nr:uncharacterized protein K02A2.6-like [Macrosteles quadrilineatus]
MKMLARSYVWWPGMEKSIEDVVASCSACQLTRNSVPKVPLQQWPTTSTRWQRIHIDFAEDPESRQQLLVLIDTYSKWLDVFIMSSMNSSKVIEKLRTLFSSYGLPVELVSDNGRSFTSQEFKTFLHNNNVKFTLTPPYHAASNGSAERSVQEVKKNLLRQVIEEHQRSQRTTLQMKLDNFLFAYRNTPNTVTGLTPAEMFLSWKPRTQLVMLKPNLQSSIHQKHREQKDAADRLRGRSRFFSEGQAVYVKTVRNEKISWVPGKIILKRSPVTYLVSVIGGKPRFCHADHLRARYAEEEEIFVSPKDPVVSPQAYYQSQGEPRASPASANSCVAASTVQPTTLAEEVCTDCAKASQAGLDDPTERQPRQAKEADLPTDVIGTRDVASPTSSAPGQDTQPTTPDISLHNDLNTTNEKEAEIPKSLISVESEEIIIDNSFTDVAECIWSLL